MEDLIKIESLIHEIRGQRVMLDFDLARVYGIETAQLKRSVRRNIERFEGEDFMFEVTREELSRCQIGTLNTGRGGNIKYLPFAFTELGVAMLSSVLNSHTAIETNRMIMRTFVSVRHLALDNPSRQIAALRQYIDEIKADMEEMFADQNDINEDTRMQLELIGQALAALQRKDEPQPQRRKIGFKQNSDE